MDFIDEVLRLKAALRCTIEPIAISFLSAVPPEPAAFSAEMPSATPDGRTGSVSAGCVFWMHSVERSFTTSKQDHANCSVGSFTHGFIPLSQAAGHADVATLVGAGWVSEADFGGIEHIKEEPTAISYGPLATSEATPDVVLLRLNAMAAMIFRDAFPEARVEGKPQCHIVAIAHETKAFALSFGCMLSRTRTKMSSNEMTAAIPGSRLGEAIERLETTAGIDRNVAAYASLDSKRFTQDKE